MLDLIHGAAARHARVVGERWLVAVAGIFVALLDQEPVLFAAILFARLHAHQHEVAVEAVAVQPELEVALGEPLVWIADRLPGAASQSITGPPPFALGITPSNLPYSSGWSSVITARRFCAGSRLGPWSRPSSSAPRHARA